MVEVKVFIVDEGENSQRQLEGFRLNQAMRVERCGGEPERIKRGDQERAENQENNQEAKKACGQMAGL